MKWNWVPWKRHSHQSYWRVAESTRSASSIQLRLRKERGRNQKQWKQRKQSHGSGSKSEKVKRVSLKKNVQGNWSSWGSMLRSSPVLIFEAIGIRATGEEMISSFPVEMSGFPVTDSNDLRLVSEISRECKATTWDSLFLVSLSPRVSGFGLSPLLPVLIKSVHALNLKIICWVGRGPNCPRPR